MKRIALFIADFFEDNELYYPYFRLLEAGHKVDLIGPHKSRGFKSKNGATQEAALAIDEVSASDYDALIIPGGYSPDHMRRSRAMINFTRAMDRDKKLIASICHGPWMLASACDLKGKKLTGFFSIKDDLENAGATFLDEACVVDGHIVTSRTPKDLPIFMKTFLNQLN